MVSRMQVWQAEGHGEMLSLFGRFLVLAFLFEDVKFIMQPHCVVTFKKASSDSVWESRNQIGSVKFPCLL